ncbi:sensor histidine kinase [Falsiroseomonas selenitidurans]|uniref:histidine kinase n=1 Tax=Falsiroseomonas selenitidurans TaxID=2716335 RepID=A0ABX1DWQ8_9PROT|nr:HAMP domain-containing sensor histidine kinase [Falsiroseomonas selenitidurans]NKC29331.1 HAMP domain-containing histidine kinase [Falsiroseomonas selenitidurans]
MRAALARLAPRSTARQVALVVGAVALLSNLLLLGAWRWLDPAGLLPGPVRQLESEVVVTLRGLLGAAPEDRPALRRAAARQGFDLLPLAEAPAGDPPHSPIGQGLERALLREGLVRRAGFAAEPPGRPWGGSAEPPPLQLWLELADGSLLRFGISGARLAEARPSPLLPSTSFLLLVGLPLVLVPLWAARRVTGPLTRLARMAESVGLEGRADAPVLPETGTTEVRQVAAAINRLLERLRRDLEERRRLLAGISHDLRTPLTRLHLRVDAMPPDALRARLMLDVRAMELLVESALGLLETELRPEAAERLDLAVLAETVCDGFADAGLDVRFEGPPHCAVLGQPRGLERALANLVDNAVKHAGGARLLLSVRPGQISLAVEDDGPGMAEAELPLATRPFQRGAAGRGAQGNGLGLAIVAGVARAHGGQLRLANRQPRGFRAELLLPELDAGSAA